MKVEQRQILRLPNCPGRCYHFSDLSWALPRALFPENRDSEKIVVLGQDILSTAGGTQGFVLLRKKDTHPAHQSIMKISTHPLIEVKTADRP
jgi:hypothetical protein